MGIGSALLWTLLQIALRVDTRIYGIFRYHFNGLVWNVITTPGADEAVHIELDREAFRFFSDHYLAGRRARSDDANLGVETLIAGELA